MPTRLGTFLTPAPEAAPEPTRPDPSYTGACHGCSPREKPPSRTHRRITIVTSAHHDAQRRAGPGVSPAHTAQGSSPPTHPHASCDNAYALTLRTRSKLTVPPIVSSSTEARCRRRPRQLNTVAAFAHQQPPSRACTARECGAGFSRRLFFNLAHHIRLHAPVCGLFLSCAPRFPCAVFFPTRP